MPALKVIYTLVFAIAKDMFIALFREAFGLGSADRYYFADTAKSMFIGHVSKRFPVLRDVRRDVRRVARHSTRYYSNARRADVAARVAAAIEGRPSYR